MGVDSKKVIEKIINIVLDIAIFIFGIILIISIYNNVQTKILKNSYSSFFGYTVFGVQTGSMADEINAGDWIIVKKQKNFKTGEVVTYMQDGEFITHRIIQAYNDTFITKGDANNTKDAPINKDQIVGKVVKILPNFEIIKKTIFNPVVLFPLIITLYLAGVLFKKTDTSKVKASSSKIDFSKYIDKIKNIKVFDKIKDIFAKTKKINVDKIKNNIKDSINENKTKLKEKVKKIEKVKIKEIVEVKKEEVTEIKEEIVEETKEEVIESVEEVVEPIEEDREIILEPTSVVLDEEDLDKTMCFRVISVNKDEIENAYNKKIVIEEEVDVPKKIEKEIKETEKEEVIKKNLELLNKKGKKCKNIIEKCMYIKEQEIEKIVEILLDGEKSKTNYASIRDEFIKVYMDARYHNYSGDVNLEFNNKNKMKKLNELIQNTGDSLIKKYKGSDNKYSDKVYKFIDIFTLINYFENGKIPTTLKEKRDEYSKKMKKHLEYDDLDDRKVKSLIDEVIKTQKLHSGMIKYTLDKLDTNLFNINYNSLSKKNMYAIELDHNIAFSKVYSDYIVDKTYTEGVVAEDKLAVLLTLLSSQIVNNMINNDFDKKYVIYIPETIYSKSNKLDDIFDMFEDEFAKNSVVVLLQYSKMSENKEMIKKLIKQGYHFGIDINEASKFKVSDQAMFELVDYLFISSKNPNKESVLLFINKDIHNKIVYDEMSTKIGSYMR